MEKSLSLLFFGDYGEKFKYGFVKRTPKKVDEKKRSNRCQCRKEEY